MLRYIVSEHVVGPHAGPIAIRYPRGNAPGMDWGRESDPIEFGKAETLLEGDEIGLLAYGNMVAPAFEAARTLRSEGIHAGLVNLRWAKPLDAETILSVARRTGKLIVMEEGVLPGGVGAGVLLPARGGISSAIDVLLGLERYGVEDQVVPPGCSGPT